MPQNDFENLLKQTMGLDAASIGSSTIERAVRLRMSSVGLEGMEDYWQRLRSSNEELQELIETVVVPETWFFRDREAFTLLTRLVTEEWLPSHPAGVLRLLSVPCSTGEEPYSMGMALLDAGIPPGRLHVDAVDISTRALNRAKRGMYGVNSFRGESLGFRDRYFRPASNGFTLSNGAERLPGMVNFHNGNLLAADFRLGEEPYDVIFCRNLLIYFDRPTQDQVMRTLKRLLAPSGVLFVGPAEAFLASCSGFTSVNRAMSFAFRKTTTDPVKSAGLSAPAARKPARRHAAPRAQRPAKAEPLPAPLPAAPEPPPIDLGSARRLADAGRLQEAAERCEAHLRQQGPSPGVYCLLGLVHDGLGDGRSAAEFYRRAVYLDPEHAEALMHLALLSEAQGDAGAAQCLRERARRAQRTEEHKIS